jgi:hypothetical protein
MAENERGPQVAFFERARRLAGEGQLELSIELYLKGLRFDLDFLTVHQELRAVALQRKAGGGSSLGLIATMKLKVVQRGAVERLLASEKLLCYDPGNADHMLSFRDAARDAGAPATAQWVEDLIKKAEGLR